ncbi:MAG: hypothetical protein M3O91_08630, partial [Chloroflexota bacterium]|nr:hypothetical protein [Chloroflexota bacterium]
IYGAVLALYAAARYVMLELPLGRDLHRQILEARSNGPAVAYFPAAVALVAAAAFAARTRHAWRDALMLSAGTGLVVVTLLATDSSVRAFIALFATSVLFTAAVLGRSALLLWPAAAFGVVSELALLDAARVPLIYQPEVVLATGIVAFAIGVALTWGRSMFAGSARVAGLSAIAFAGAFEFEIALASRLSVVDSLAWQDGSRVLLLLAGALAVESSLRRSYAVALAAAAVALAGTLGLIARAHPRDIQAYTAPLGASLVAAAIASLRYAPAAWNERIIGLEVSGAAIALAPPYVATWGADAVSNAARLVATVLVLVALGIVFRRRWLLAVSLSFLGLGAVRAVVEAAGRVPNWVLFASAGAALLAVGFTLLVRREAWLRAQERLLSWWVRWGRPSAEA